MYAPKRPIGDHMLGAHAPCTMSSSTLTPHTPDLCGRAINSRYELRALIGEGSFGRVYRGYDRRLARPVAVKVIKPWWSEDPEWVRRFEREAQLMARVSAPGIVQIFDVGHADEGLYYVAELVEGESLDVRLRRGRLAPSDACEIGEQLCWALGHAHADRVVHGDIKPANVLISSTGTVKVGDFGVARLAEGSSVGAAATIVGTPRYMAPEQARGRGTTAATDVYSVGVVLYEMLAGQPPFSGGSAVDLALRHLQDRPPPLRGTPRELVAVTERALAKDARKRYANAAEMGGALARARRSGRKRGRWRGHDRNLPPDRVDLDRGAASRGQAGTADVPGEAPTAHLRDEAATAHLRAEAGTAHLRDQAETAHLPGERRPGRGPDDVDPTRVAPKLSARHNSNPSARRRSVALLSGVVALVLAMVAAAVVIGSVAHVRVPDLHGLRRPMIAAFGYRYSGAPRGTAIVQSPASGQRVREGSTVDVTLSDGPPPVPVPRLVGLSTADARAALARVRLRASVVQVPAPGVTPGQVTSQRPASGTDLPRNGSVSLSVAEVPQWRTLTSFTNGLSVPFRIRGNHWRLLYRMSYSGTCLFIFICSGPTAHVTNLTTGASAGSFDLNDGSGQIWTFPTGPGLYQVKITQGSDDATWSAQVQDYY
jgi:eukaryotic-like serine/threonine-protein kinase